MLTTLQGDGFCSPTGKNKLLIVSVGTGQYKQSWSGEAVVSDLAASPLCNRSWTIASG
jgi:hypothetical protein